ncbi:MAG: Uncharacterised protein [Marine Group II euryarchaeote MED-G33]|nr:MAG: Uncharacterised protein [Marine Group II euryarchaeote MED-G33]
MSADVFCNNCIACGLFLGFLFFILNMNEQKNEKAKLELKKDAQLIEKMRVENYQHSLDPEGYEHAEEFAEVLEDLVDAEHESDPDLNLEESEFAEIIDEDAVEKAKSKSRALFFIIIFIIWTLLIGSDF